MLENRKNPIVFVNRVGRSDRQANVKRLCWWKLIVGSSVKCVDAFRIDLMEEAKLVTK